MNEKETNEAFDSLLESSCARSHRCRANRKACGQAIRRGLAAIENCVEVASGEESEVKRLLRLELESHRDYELEPMETQAVTEPEDELPEPVVGGPKGFVIMMLILGAIINIVVQELWQWWKRKHPDWNQ